MSHISANNIDRKLIIVSMSMFSGSMNPNVAIIFVCGCSGSHFQNGRHEFSMSHISANNIDRKLIFVSLSLLSGPQNSTMVIILAYGVCGSHFQNGRCKFSMSHISANNGDRNLMMVSISMFSGSEKPNRINIICQSLFVFQNGCHFNKCCNYITQNNYMFLFVVSAVVYSYEALYAITLNTMIYNFTCSYAT